MNKEDNFGRLLMLLLITLCICLGLYYLPDNMFGQKIKKVDLLSDLRVKTQSLSMDSLRKQLEQPDTLEIDSVALRDSIIRSTGIDSTALVLRDSLYNVFCPGGGFARYAYRRLFGRPYRVEAFLYSLEKPGDNEPTGACRFSG